MNSQFLDCSDSNVRKAGFSRVETPIDGVSCEVKSCKYHAPGGICQASNISVEAPDASKKIETYCGTYTPNSF